MFFLESFVQTVMTDPTVNVHADLFSLAVHIIKQVFM